MVPCEQRTACEARVASAPSVARETRAAHGSIRGVRPDSAMMAGSGLLGRRPEEPSRGYPIGVAAALLECGRMDQYVSVQNVIHVKNSSLRASHYRPLAKTDRLREPSRCALRVL